MLFGSSEDHVIWKLRGPCYLEAQRTMLFGSPEDQSFLWLNSSLSYRAYNVITVINVALLYVSALPRSQRTFWSKLCICFSHFKQNLNIFISLWIQGKLIIFARLCLYRSVPLVLVALLREYAYNADLPWLPKFSKKKKKKNFFFFLRFFFSSFQTAVY